MKLLIPVLLRKALLACFAVGTLYSGGTTIAADLTLGSEDTLSINYAESDSIPNLENGTLRLNGDTLLRLVECGEGNGKTYTLLTGVSGLLDKDGNALALGSTNNAASLYFDATQPGTGFWADATLQLTTDGTLQLVRYTDISIPSGYREVLVDAVSDITYYNRYATDVAFRITQDLKISGLSSSLMTYSSGSWYFTSDSVEHLASLTFSNATSCLFVVSDGDDEKLEFSRLERVEFSGNKASSSGVAIHGYGSTITLSNNGSVTFSGNTAYASSSSASVSGGAINVSSNSTITLSNNGSVTFSGNKASSSYASASASGGAIYVGISCTITLSDNESVTFSGNKASSSYASGGAIKGDSSSTITLNNNGSVTFSGNTANSGGAIYGGSSSTITLSNNGSVTFSGNTASSRQAYGGAINGDTITLSNNGSVTFSGNTASSDSYDSYAYGVAIYGDYGSTITLSDNESVTFSGNTASSSRQASGGAIYGGSSSAITLSGNGSVTFSGNTASSSRQASSSARGGAIYSNGIVTITGNDEVTFAQNVEKSGSTYRLRSLYLVGDDSTDKLTLSAGEKQSIRFYDSVYMGAKGSVALNADYTDAEGAMQKATGTILFSGATTEDDLKAAKGGVAGTEEEILNSRTSEINSAATLYGGTLQVQDKAVLKLNGGLTVADGSKASVQVQAAELNVGSHALNMVSGSSLLLSDGAKLTATELTISNGAELAVKAITANSPVQNLSAAFTIDTTPSTGYDASRAYNVLAGGKIDAALLTLAAGATYTANASNLSLSDGELTLAITSTATKRIELNLTLSADYDPAAQVVLFSDVATVNFIRDGITAKSTDGAVYTLGAADYFNSVWINNMTTLVYDSNQKVVYLEGVSNVPEPTTSTLGLLALAALAARRRRK